MPHTGETMKTAATSLAFACLLLMGCANTGTAPAPRALLAVVSKGLPGVTLFDAVTDQQICQAKMDVAPHEEIGRAHV